MQQGKRAVRVHDAAESRPPRVRSTCNCTATASATSRSRSTMRMRRFDEAVKRGAEPAHRAARRRRQSRPRSAGQPSTPTATRSTRSSRSTTISGPFLPGYRRAARAWPRRRHPRIDHIVGQRRARQDGLLGRLVHRACWASSATSASTTRTSRTEYSALMSIVMSDDATRSSFRSTSRRPGGARARSTSISTIYGGPGVQHIALLTPTSCETVTALARNGVEFLRVPPSYYDQLPRASARSTRTSDDRPAAGHSRGPRRGGLPAAAVHASRRGSADAVLRDHPAQGQPRLRQGQLPRALRGDRARAGAPRKLSKC